MTDDSTAPEPWARASAAEIAAAAGADDLFVFRRVSGGTFAHVGGVGRGAGWAGIVEICAESEPLVDEALSGETIVRRTTDEPSHVLGPYYAHAVAVVPVSTDSFVLFGSPAGELAETEDDDLRTLAAFASEALVEVEPAKRLADELETMNAVRDLLRAPATSFDEALQRLVDHATAALSCDLGFAYLPDRAQLAVCNLNGATFDPDVARSAVAVLAELDDFPVCVQQAHDDELPAPFRSADGVLAYYLLKLERPHPGVLLLLHTEAGAARGFTLLCQRLGARLVEASESLLGAAVLRDTLQEQLELAAALARTDSLTGLANRLAWEEALAGVTPCPENPVSILQVDCRGLKHINDTRGHHMGDQLLHHVAAVLVASVRGDDLVARLGGDEFGVLLYGADEHHARSVVSRIELALAAEREAGTADVHLAIGHATTKSDDVKAAQQLADKHMLAAKRQPVGRRR